MPQAPAPQTAPAPEPAAPTGTFLPGEGRSQGSYNAGNPGTGDRAARGWATNTIRNRYTDAMNRTGDLAERAEGGYLDRAESFNAGDYLEQPGFDAMNYVNTAAQGAFGQFLPQLREDIGELRGQQVGMGRLNTGFATEDEDRLVTRSLSDLGDHVAGLSMQGAGLQSGHNQANADRRMRAGGLQLENDRGLGQFGMEYGNRYLDLIAGQYDRKTAETNSKKGKFWNDVGGVADIGLGFL
jgi:hypothetical protein